MIRRPRFFSPAIIPPQPTKTTIMKFPALSSLAVACAALFFTLPGLRAQGMYLKMQGVTGSVVNANQDFAGTVEVVSFGFGASRGVTVGNPNVNVSAPQISELSLTAALDPKAYPELLEKSLTNGEITGIKLQSVASFSPLYVPLEIEFDGVLSSFSTSQAGSDSAGGFMQISFTLTKIKVTTRTIDNQGNVTDVGPTTWNLKTNAP